MHQAALVLEGDNAALQGALTLLVGAHEVRSKLSGRVETHEFRAEDGMGGTFAAQLSDGARLDGMFKGPRGDEPLHLVRVVP